MSSKWLQLFPRAERTEAEFLLDGRYAFYAIHEEIKKTRTGDYIYILGWMLDSSLRLIPEDPSTSLTSMLESATKRGVAVRVLIWKNMLPGMLENTEKSIKQINKLQPTSAFLDDYTFYPERCRLVLEAFKFLSRPLLYAVLITIAPLFVIPPVKNLPKLVWKIIAQLKSITNLAAHHEKITIVKNKDGLVAFCGGIEYNRNRMHIDDDSNDYFPKYHDNACRLKGPAAFQILEKFRMRWDAHPVARQTTLPCAQEPRPPPASSQHPHAWIVGTYNRPDGRSRTRTLRKAYFAIIDAASTYIYIEDQYMVSREIALRLNAKIKETAFEKVILVSQAADEAMDILIPVRKRDEFMTALLDGATEQQKKKVVRTLIDKEIWRRRHPGLHAKTLIADDEIAIIGSNNVNQRSLTCDSETSVVLFGGQIGSDRTFAQSVRQDIWQEFLPNSVPSLFYREWRPLVRALEEGARGFAQITLHVKDNASDVDDLIRTVLLAGSAAVLPFTRRVAKAGLPAALTIGKLFDVIWDYIIDPDIDVLSP